MDKPSNTFSSWLTLAACVFLPLAAVAAIFPSVAAGQTLAFEEPLMMWVHNHIGTWFAPIATVMHYVGKTSLAVPLLTLLAAWLALKGRRDYAVFIVLATLLPTLIMLAIKVTIARPRPELWPRLIDESNFSFPSGHSTFGAALATIAVLIWLHSPHRAKILWAGVCFALLMGFSRIYLGVHYPTDVLVGWVNGTLTTLALYFFFFRKRFPR